MTVTLQDLRDAVISGAVLEHGGADTVVKQNLNLVNLGSYGSDRELGRLLSYATLAVLTAAPGAPDAAHNQAAAMLVTYLYDRPNASRGVAFANALRNSGAGSVLLPYKRIGAGSTRAAATASEGEMTGLGLTFWGGASFTVTDPTVWLVVAVSIPTADYLGIQVSDSDRGDAPVTLVVNRLLSEPAQTAGAAYHGDGTRIGRTADNHFAVAGFEDGAYILNVWTG